MRLFEATSEPLDQVEDTRTPWDKLAIEPGNVDLAHRPHVKNADGSISTVRSVGVNLDGVEVLLPTVSEDGKILTPQQAVEVYRQTGKHLGKYKTVDDSNRAAQAIHQDQEQRLKEQEAAARVERIRSALARAR
jgi:hypothetical protein